GLAALFGGLEFLPGFAQGRLGLLAALLRGSVIGPARRSFGGLRSIPGSQRGQTRGHFVAGGALFLQPLDQAGMATASVREFLLAAAQLALHLFQLRARRAALTACLGQRLLGRSALLGVGFRLYRQILDACSQSFCFGLVLRQLLVQAGQLRSQFVGALALLLHAFAQALLFRALARQLLVCRGQGLLQRLLLLLCVFMLLLQIL